MTLSDYSRSRRCSLATAAKYAKSLGYVRTMWRYDVDPAAIDEARSKVKLGRPRILTDEQRAMRIIPDRLLTGLATKRLLVDRQEMIRLAKNELKRRELRRHERRPA